MLLDDCFRPLIGVIIFQPKYMLSLIKTDQYKFPSPYRGYHLSTFELPGKKAGFPGIVSVPLSGLSSFNYLRNSYFYLFHYVSVPLSGLSSFNYLRNSSFYLFQYVSVPLSGLSSFNSSIDIIYLILYMLCFRPLIGVIIFQQCMQVWMIMQQSFPSPYRGYHLSTRRIHLETLLSFGFRPLIGVIIFQHCIGITKYRRKYTFPSPYRGYHLSTLPPFSPYFIRLSRGFSVPKI